MEAMHKFFANSALLEQLNNAMVALIPKGKHAPTVGDFRPISCCNVVYKVITKVLAKRLSPILNCLLDKAQGAFEKGF